ncbi:hypothetical protein Tco_1430089 [Tanacetum coccineum]
MSSQNPSQTYPMPSPSVSTFTFPSTTEPVFSASTSEPVFESPNHTQTSQTTQSQQLQQYHTTTVSNNNAKFPYLKKEEYETWAMKMEYWIMNSDHNLWNIVLNGNSRKTVLTAALAVLSFPDLVKTACGTKLLLGFQSSMIGALGVTTVVTSKFSLSTISSINVRSGLRGKKGFGLSGLSRVTGSSLGVRLGDEGFCEDDSDIMVLKF